MPTKPTQQPPRFGDGRFEPVAPLGVRTNGGVFLARDRERGEECALKLLDETSVPPEAIARFQAEARVLSRLRHPHLVHARGHGQDHGFSWYAMDLLPGGDLQALLRVRGPLPAEHALALGFQVLLGLDALHAAGLVHRDVKLTNVLLDEAWRGRLSDLGVAHHPQGEVPYDTRTGQELGTPGYGAPEQWEHAGKVGPVADLFAAGVVVYRLLTKRPPDRLHLAHYRPKLLDGIDAAVQQVLLRATQVVPGSRYATAREMAAAVADAASRIGVADARGWVALLDDPEAIDPWAGLRAWLMGGPGRADA